MNIKENVHLKLFTTFNVGGPARYFIEAQKTDDLVEVVHRVRKENAEMFVLGAGSNILISDEGFNGYVVRINIQGIDIENLGGGNYDVIAGAGVDWDTLVEFVVNKSLWGVENLSLIPGSVGGSVVQNIGAYGAEIKDVVRWVEVFDTERGMTQKLTRAECEFEYRDSIFKQEEGSHYIVTRVCLMLKDTGEPKTTYKDIAMYLKKNNIQKPTLDQIRSIIVGIRTQKFPSKKQAGSAGSFFMNPVVSRFRYMWLRFRYPGLPGYPTVEGVKISAAWIIDNVCNLKGLRVGNVGLYQNQPLVLVTNKDACAEDVKRLAEFVQREVYSKTKIKLVPEVTFVGF